MNKILYGILFSAVCVCGAWAGAVCAKSDIVVIALDPSIGGSSYTYNNDTGVWKTTFSYGDVSGISACLTVNGGSMGTPDSTISAVAAQADGQYCWCKMLHPMESVWVFNYDYGSVSDCRSSCASSCGNDVQSNAALRGGLFRSVGI